MNFIKRLSAISLLLLTVSVSQGGEVRAASVSVKPFESISKIERQSCYTDMWGTTKCSGSVGGSRTSNSCYTDMWGTTNCSGSAGGSRTSNSCYTDMWGTTNCSGSAGGRRTSSSCYTDMWGTTNCSGKP